jgi:hypothetical protein
VGGFTDWMMSQRVRRVVFIAGLFPLPLMGVFSSAIVVMVARLKGPREAALDCLFALAVLAVMALFSGAIVSGLWGGAVLTWGVSLLLGSIVSAYGSLTLAVQASVILAVLVTIVFALIVGDPVVFWREMLQQFADEAAESGFGLIQPAVIEQAAPLMSGALAASAWCSAMVALMLGIWWSRNLKPIEFGAMFRTLKLGYVIGILATILGIAAWLGWPPLAGNLLMVVSAGFLLQGVAVMSWWAWKKNWSGGWRILLFLPVALLFVMPVPAVLWLFTLTIIGFVDNWYNLRR